MTLDKKWFQDSLDRKMRAFQKGVGNPSKEGKPADAPDAAHRLTAVTAEEEALSALRRDDEKEMMLRRAFKAIVPKGPEMTFEEWRRNLPPPPHGTPVPLAKGPVVPLADGRWCFPGGVRPTPGTHALKEGNSLKKMMTDDYYIHDSVHKIAPSETGPATVKDYADLMNECMKGLEDGALAVEPQAIMRRWARSLSESNARIFGIPPDPKEGKHLPDGRTEFIVMGARSDEEGRRSVMASIQKALDGDLPFGRGPLTERITAERINPTFAYTPDRDGRRVVTATVNGWI